MLTDKRDPYSIARKRMINEQLVARGITDAKLLEIMSLVPRHEFVDDALKAQAYADAPQSIGSGQTISQPYIVALMTEALKLTGKETVLEIGTGCGYQTVILAKLAKQVYTIERVKSLAMAARQRLKNFNLKNIVIRVGDGTLGWPEAAPFDRIIIACAAPKIPENLVAQLAVGGLMVIPVTVAEGLQEMLRITRTPDGFKTENLGNCHFVPMIGKFAYEK